MASGLEPKFESYDVVETSIILAKAHGKAFWRQGGQASPLRDAWDFNRRPERGEDSRQGGHCVSKGIET